MALTNLQKILLTGTKATLPEKRDTNVLYFCSDTRELYKGNDLYTEAVRVSTDRPTQPAQGVLYIIGGKTAEVYTGTSWVVVAREYVTSIDEDATDDTVPTSKAVNDAIKAAVADAASSDGVVNTVISTKAGTITVNKGAFKKLADDAAFAEGTQYYAKEGNNYVAATVSAESFADKLATGLYTSANSTDVAVKGVVTNPTYDPEDRKITLPIIGADPLVITLGKDVFLNPAAPNRYNTDNHKIELYLNDGSFTASLVYDADTPYFTKDESGKYTAVGKLSEEQFGTGTYYTSTCTLISIDAQDLIDTYTGEATNTAKTTVSDDNKISVDIKLSEEEGNVLTAKEDGLYVSLTDSNEAIADLKKKVETNSDNIDSLTLRQVTTDASTTSVIAGSFKAIEAADKDKYSNIYTLETDADSGTPKLSKIADVDQYIIDHPDGALLVAPNDQISQIETSVENTNTRIDTLEDKVKDITYVPVTADSVYDSDSKYYTKSEGGEFTECTKLAEDNFATYVASGLYQKITDAYYTAEKRVHEIENTLVWGTWDTTTGE